MFFGTIGLVLFGGIDGGVVDVQDIKVGFFGGSVGFDDGPHETRTGGVIGTMSAKKVEGGLEGVQGGELDKRGMSGKRERRREVPVCLRGGCRRRVIGRCGR